MNSFMLCQRGEIKEENARITFVSEFCSYCTVEACHKHSVCAIVVNWLTAQVLAIVAVCVWR